MAYAIYNELKLDMSNFITASFSDSFVRMIIVISFLHLSLIFI